MYIPEHFAIKHPQDLYAIIREHPLGALVTMGPDGLDANHIPFEFDAGLGALGQLTAHVARANPVWQQCHDGADVLVIFRGNESYISPNWYPSKHETHRQVPTWNYEVVHVHGHAKYQIVAGTAHFFRGMEGNVISIRMAQEADFVQWLPLWKGYQTFYKTSISEDTTAITWSRFHNTSEPMHCAVAEREGQLIGMVHYIQHRSCWTTGDYIYLQDLFVEPQERGSGTGRALIEHVYESAEKSGASRVWWLTHESNTDAMLLYDRIADKSGFLQYRKLI